MSEARSVLGVICSAYDSFFEAEKKIADYIMEHKEQAVDMTVGELAKASGTSDATVSRFCRRCGFKGFQNLKLTLAREILEEEHQSQEVTNDIDRTDLEQSLKNILANKIAELTETIKMMDIKNLEVILDKLEHARIVQLAAVGNTIPVALDGAFKLNQLGIPAVAGDIWEAQAAYAFNLGPEDVVLIISNSGSSKRLETLALGAKENGSTLVLAFIINVIAIIIYSRPWIEIISQIGYVIVISFFIYLILWIPRGILIFLSHLFRRKK